LEISEMMGMRTWNRWPGGLPFGSRSPGRASWPAIDPGCCTRTVRRAALPGAMEPFPAEVAGWAAWQ